MRETQEDSSFRAATFTESINTVEDDVLLLKLGSAAVLKLKEQLQKISRPLSKATQGLKNIV